MAFNNLPRRCFGFPSFFVVLCLETSIIDSVKSVWAARWKGELTCYGSASFLHLSPPASWSSRAAGPGRGEIYCTLHPGRQLPPLTYRPAWGVPGPGWSPGTLVEDKPELYCKRKTARHVGNKTTSCVAGIMCLQGFVNFDQIFLLKIVSFWFDWREKKIRSKKLNNECVQTVKKQE